MGKKLYALAILALNKNKTFSTKAYAVAAKDEVAARKLGLKYARLNYPIANGWCHYRCDVKIVRESIIKDNIRSLQDILKTSYLFVVAVSAKLNNYKTTSVCVMVTTDPAEVGVGAVKTAYTEYPTSENWGSHQWDYFYLNGLIRQHYLRTSKLKFWIHNILKHLKKADV